MNVCIIIWCFYSRRWDGDHFLLLDSSVNPRLVGSKCWLGPKPQHVIKVGLPDGSSRFCSMGQAVTRISFLMAFLLTLCLSQTHQKTHSPMLPYDPKQTHGCNFSSPFQISPTLRLRYNLAETVNNSPGL